MKTIFTGVATATLLTASALVVPQGPAAAQDTLFHSFVRGGVDPGARCGVGTRECRNDDPGTEQEGGGSVDVGSGPGSGDFDGYEPPDGEFGGPEDGDQGGPGPDAPA